jgi:acyl-CoA dehydrogenase
MDLSPTPRSSALRDQLVDFMRSELMPAEGTVAEEVRAQPRSWGPPPTLDRLKKQARDAGLWNLFRLPHGGRDGLTNLEYAPLAEIMGWSPHVAPEVFNCSAPDTGNMELLDRFGSDDQKARWLQPLLDGQARSCFSMTEPDVASSDATNIRTEIFDGGDHWVINGRKWWTTGALRPDCVVSMVMGVTDPDAPPSCRQSIVLVPMDAPGLQVLRSTTVLGFDDRHEGGHGELDFVDVRVPKENLLGDRGAGFAVAQARLGPGRIHHCMRLTGMAERAIALMVERARTRVAFGVPLIEQGAVQTWIADARTHTDAARLMVLTAAARMDIDGAKAARHDIAAAKILVPTTVKKVVDDAMQVFGAKGLSQDTPLAMLFSQARFLQIADGPDEVHRRSLAQAEAERTPLLPV